jgi:hypothetical protein
MWKSRITEITVRCILHSVVDINNNHSEHRPYITPSSKFLQEPFVKPHLRAYFMSSTVESLAISSCVKRLWMLHCGKFDV